MSVSPRWHEHRVISEDIDDAAGYGHGWLRSTGGLQAHQPLSAVHTPDRSAGHGLDPAGRSPDDDATSRCMPSGMGRSPARVTVGFCDDGVGVFGPDKGLAAFVPAVAAPPPA